MERLCCSGAASSGVKALRIWRVAALQAYSHLSLLLRALDLWVSSTAHKLQFFLWKKFQVAIGHVCISDGGAERDAGNISVRKAELDG